MTAIAVIDVETTGISPWRHNRVVEVAAVVVEADGRIVREFVSLINPERDIGPTCVHGIASEDVLGAPRFAEIAGAVVDVIGDTVAIAGHNVWFDHSFMSVEFERQGWSFPDVPRFCTLRMAGGGSLVDCCDAYSVPFEGETHEALADARASARLLARLLSEDPDAQRRLAACQSVSWPRIPKTDVQPRTRDTVKRLQNEPPTFLRRLLSRRPTGLTSAPEDSAAIAYASILDRVLEDRKVDEQEADGLVEMATRWGLDGDAVAQVHDEYLRSIAIAALADHIISDSERRDLLCVSRLLGISADRMQMMLAGAMQRLASITPSGQRALEPADDVVGKLVCFTGDILSRYRGEPITRELAERLARDAGMEISSSVTKKLDVLVVADPHTQSGKAKKARQYGVRIVQELVFWKAIGVEIE